VAVQDRELDLADKLIGILETNWDPSSYRDEYRDRVLELIEGKARAEGTLAVPEERPEPASRIPELLEALKASVEQARGQAQPEEKGKARSPKGRRTG
jgi:DNA end-binding protein Ku